MRLGRRRKGIRWEYNGDGRYPTERYSVFFKKYWRRWKRRIGKNEVQQGERDMGHG